MSWTTIGIEVALIATVPYVTFKRLSTAPAVRCTINTAQPNYARSITRACTPVYTSDVALNRDRAVVPALRDTRSFPNTYHRLPFALLYNLHPLSSIFLLFHCRVVRTSLLFLGLVSFSVSFHLFIYSYYFFQPPNLVPSFPTLFNYSCTLSGSLLVSRSVSFPHHSLPLNPLAQFCLFSFLVRPFAFSFNRFL